MAHRCLWHLASLFRLFARAAAVFGHTLVFWPLVSILVLSFEKVLVPMCKSIGRKLFANLNRRQLLYTNSFVMYMIQFKSNRFVEGCSCKIMQKIVIGPRKIILRHRKMPFLLRDIFLGLFVPVISSLVLTGWPCPTMRKGFEPHEMLACCFTLICCLGRFLGLNLIVCQGVQRVSF